MASRDFKSEYRRRLATGVARGLTRSQARGHGSSRKSDPGARPIASDPKLEAALRALRRTGNQTVAAKEAHVAPERLRRFLKAQGLAARDGRRWVITDLRPRLMTALTTRGVLQLTLPSFEEASLIGRHNAAVKSFMDTNDFAFLRPFEGTVVKDTSGRAHVLETRPNVIRRLDASGETYEQIYRIVS